MNLWETLFLFPAIQGIVLSIYLLVKPSINKEANIIWAIFIALFAINVFINVVFWSQFNTDLMLTFSLTTPILLSLYGPLYYMYIRKLALPSKNSNWELLLLVPFLILLVRYLPYAIAPLEEKLFIYKENLFTSYSIPYSGPVMVLYMIFLGFLAYRVLRVHFIRDREIRIWLTLISISYLLFCLFNGIYFALVFTGSLKIGMDYWLTVFMILFILFTSYFGFIFPKVFNGMALKKVVPFIKYEKTGLTPGFSIEMKEKLDQLMSAKKPYLDNGIDLNSISLLLDLPRHHASQIINEHYGMGFFDFINSYRINDAANLLIEDSKLSIEDVGYEVGFNNRISFYKAFKKFKGMSPSEYRTFHHTAS